MSVIVYIYSTKTKQKYELMLNVASKWYKQHLNLTKVWRQNRCAHVICEVLADIFWKFDTTNGRDQGNKTAKEAKRIEKTL